MRSPRTAIWRRHDLPGHEVCRIDPIGDGWQLAGVAAFAYHERPCRLDYGITCDASWVTLSAVVNGWIGDQVVAATIVRDAGAEWRLNGRAVDAVNGCTDIDLNFSPSTNLLPIRRLGLAVGGIATVRAAWLRFPDLSLEPLEQTYTRERENLYRYESGRFATDVTVDDIGLAVRYGNIWSREAPV